MLARKNRMEFADPREQPRHDARRADGVREPRVIGARVGERRETELLDAPEALDLRGPEEQRDDGFFRRLEGNQAVDGVAQDQAPST